MTINLSEPIVLKPAVEEVKSTSVKIGRVEVSDDKVMKVTVIDTVTGVIVKEHTLTASDDDYNQIISIVEDVLVESGAVSGTIE